MKNTKIDWAGSTWNPVTGCKNDCPYCYARRIAERFGGYTSGMTFENVGEPESPLWVIYEPVTKTTGRGNEQTAPYPFDFAPTLHKYRLDIPKTWKEPATIFVCSMGELFGDWVPLEWIQEVFQSCQQAPQHKYLFLTKNPERYLQLGKDGLLPSQDNFWYGTTITKAKQPFFFSRSHNTFVSVEPMQEDFGEGAFDGTTLGWVIVGAETGKRTGKILPEKSWIDNLYNECRKSGIPIFMKESVEKLMGEDFRREFPWDPKESEGRINE
jgi:protein gp37